MEKFKVDNLHKTIEEQAKKIETYKKKLKDVVEAYKDLNEEKLALEASINALTKSPSEHQNVKETKNQNPGDNENNDQESILNQADKSSNITKDSKEEEANICSGHSQTLPDDQQQKLGVLTSSLMTLTKQKNKSEINWVAERKQNNIILEEKNKEIENLLKQIQQSENDIGEWRGKLRSQQTEHSRQQEDCTLIIKELQALLNAQKMQNEDRLSQINDLKMAMEVKNKSTSAHMNAILEREKLIKSELDTKKEELAETLNKMSNTSPQIQALKQQVAQLKDRDEGRVLEETEMVQEIENRLREAENEHEVRVHAMELKVLQLTEVLGEVERNKKEHQDTVQKLREKNAQLDLEIATLTTLTCSSDLDSMLEELDNEGLYNKAKIIIGKLQYNNQYSGYLQDLVLKEGDLHKQCKSQLDQLQEEFERYKLRAQSVLKNKSKETNMEQETVKLKSHISELKDKVKILHQKRDDLEQELKCKEDSFSMMLKSLESKHSSEMEKLVAETRQKVGSMEGEMRRQRDRTVSMLADKDQEIAELRCRVAPLEGNKALPFNTDEVGASSAVSEDTSMTVEQLLSSRAKEQLRSSDRMLHYAQEKAMMEVQMGALRKEKYQLETELKEGRLEWVEREGRLQEEVVVLKEEVRRGDRAVMRGSANLEYLKNIVFQYMVARDSSSKQQIAKAISTILQFSPSEKNILYTRKGWFANTPHKNS